MYHELFCLLLNIYITKQNNQCRATRTRQHTFKFPQDGLESPEKDGNGTAMLPITAQVKLVVELKAAAATLAIVVWTANTAIVTVAPSP